jgi:hypothetical protein
MLRYRSAAFWTRVYAPELSMGMHTADEVEDMGSRQVRSAGAEELQNALQEVEVVQGQPVAEGPEGPTRASDSQLEGLADLVAKARETGAADLALTEASASVERTMLGAPKVPMAEKVDYEHAKRVVAAKAETEAVAS